MIIEVTEIEYKGFFLRHNEEKGWEIVLFDKKILFPTMQDAQSAVNAFYRDIVPDHKGKVIQ